MTSIIRTLHDIDHKFRIFPMLILCNNLTPCGSTLPIATGVLKHTIMKKTIQFLALFATLAMFSQAGHIMQGVGAINMSMGGAATGQPLDISGALCGIRQPFHILTALF